MLTLDLFSTKLLTSQLFSTLCSCILCTLLFWSLGNCTFLYMVSFHLPPKPLLQPAKIILNSHCVLQHICNPSQFHIICKFSNYNPGKRMKSTNESAITGPRLTLQIAISPIWEWINGYSEQTAFALSILETELFSRYKYYNSNLLLYFPKQIYNRHSNCSQNNTQILLNMLLKFILAETNREIYQVLTTGPLSQALSENICLYMSRRILTHKAVKMNMSLTNASVENFDRHQKIQCFSLSITCKTRDYEFNCTMFIVH